MGAAIRFETNAKSINFFTVDFLLGFEPKIF
jgi:hypothetical protein